MRREIKNAIFCSRLRRPFCAEVPPHRRAQGAFPLNFPKFLKKIPTKRVYKLRETVL